MIHRDVPAEIARYEQRASGGMTRYTRAEVEAAYADLKAAEAVLDAACEAANAVLEPYRVDMGMWREVQNERYQRLEALLGTTLDVPWAHAGYTKEKYPLSQWTRAAKAWRALAERIQREVARIA